MRVDRTQLHHLVDDLPDSEVERALGLLVSLLGPEADAEAAFFKAYAARHGSLERLDASIAQADRGEFATEEEVREVFGT